MIESVPDSLTGKTHLKAASLNKRSGFFMGKIVKGTEKGSLVFQAPGLKVKIPEVAFLKPGMPVKIEIRNSVIVSFQVLENKLEPHSELKPFAESLCSRFQKKAAQLTGKSIREIRSLWEGEDLAHQAFSFKSIEEIIHFFKERTSSKESFSFKQNGTRLFVYPFCLGEDRNSIHGSIRRYLPLTEVSTTFISAKSSIGKLTFCNIDSDTVPVLLYSNIRKELTNRLMSKLTEIFEKEVLYSEEAAIVVREEKFWTSQQVDISR